MKKPFPVIIAIALLSGFLSACGSSSTKPSNSSVVERKANRAANSAERRVDQHTDLKINNAKVAYLGIQ